MILEGNQCCNESLITTALALYAEALAALQAAIQDPQRAKEDATLMGTALLCIFEVRTPHKRERRTQLTTLYPRD